MTSGAKSSTQGRKGFKKFFDTGRGAWKGKVGKVSKKLKKTKEAFETGKEKSG